MFGPDGSSRISRGVYENFLRACCTFRQRADSFDQWPAILSVGTLRVFGSCRSFAVLWNDTSVIGQSNHVVISFLDVFVVKRWRSRGRKDKRALKAFSMRELQMICAASAGDSTAHNLKGWEAPFWGQFECLKSRQSATWWPYGWPPHGHLMFRGPGSGACPNAEFLDKELPPCIAAPILRALSEMTATRLLHPELRPFIGCGTRLWI